MSGGYVLGFSDRTFREFFEYHIHIDIDAERYSANGTSKANRLRCFWSLADSHTAGKIIEEMILYGQAENWLCKDSDTKELTDDCLKVAKRLLLDKPVTEVDSLTATTDEPDFKILEKNTREAIEQNQPEAV